MFFVIVILVIIIVFLANQIRIVPQQACYIIERLGKYSTTWEAGLHVKVPVIDKIVKKISIKEQVYDFPPQDVITKDNVTISIDSVVYASVFDPKLYTYGIEKPITGLQNLTATTLRSIIGAMELDQTLSSRADINRQMQDVLDEATDEWGIKVSRVEVKNIKPALSFTFRCKPARLRSDGIPVCILFQDTLSGRKSMRVDFAVKIDNRLYILDSMEVNHRTKMSGDEIADNIIKRFEVCYTADLNLNITANDIIKNVLQKGLVPKKAEERFVTYMSSINTDTPIAMASDVIKTGIFNIKNKKHTSSGYDGGKRRYELELGRALIR